jgi:hypothetical protein
VTSSPNFKLTNEILSERDLQESIIRILDALIQPPAFFFSAAIGAAKLSPQQAAALSRAGVKRGIPDVLILAPDDHGPRIFGLELKREKQGYLSRDRIVRTKRGSPRLLEGQQSVFPRLEAAGMTIAIARSVDEVLAQLEAWGVPLRGRVAAKRLPRADEIHDEDFTGGLESAEYVRRLREGTLE